MNEWFLISGLVFFLTVAIGFAVYPLRQQKAMVAALLLFIPLLVGLAYWHWGAFEGWNLYLHQKEQESRVAEFMKSVKSPQVLLDRLKLQLKQQPESAKGWYLLGRLYASQGDWKSATQSSLNAHQLSPDNEAYTIYYAQTLWQENHQQFNEQILQIFKDVLENNPNQADALAMLAMNAFMGHAYEEAISYWQRLLKLAPAQSEEALAIRQAIARAQQHVNERTNHDGQNL